MSRPRRRHPQGCGHCPRVRALGREYRGWRWAFEAREEEATYGYATEQAMYRREHRAPTFKDFLVQMQGTGWPMSGHAAVGLVAVPAIADSQSDMGGWGVTLAVCIVGLLVWLVLVLRDERGHEHEGDRRTCPVCASAASGMPLVWYPHDHDDEKSA